MSRSDGGRDIVAIVDDDPSVRRALSRLVGTFGLDVECYASAVEFLAAVGDRWVTCLLLDLHLEGLSGLQLIDLLIEMGKLPPTIIITSDAEAAAGAPAHRRITTVLPKPVDIEDLTLAVGRAIGRDVGAPG